MEKRDTTSLLAGGRSTMSPSYSPQSVVLDHGKGMRVWDREGKEYLDFLGGIAVLSLGHAHPAMVAALTDQISKLTHISNIYFSEPQILLQEELVRRTFADRVFFCNSGAEANEAAIKLARRHARIVQRSPKFELITLEGSFHGRTYGAVSATAQPKYHEGFEPMVPGFSYAKFNDLASVEARWTAHTAAVMVEPVQGEGGVRVASRPFMQGLRRLCDERGALLIVDEVQSGIGRTGRFLATEHYGIEPDIVTLAKGLGGGVPIGATLATESVAAAFTKGSHGTTFGGNPLAARAALTVLETVDREGLTENAARVGAYFLGRMRALARTQPRIREVRGLGLMVGVEVNGTADDATALMVKGVQNGLLFNTAGGNTLRFVPPLVATEADVDLAVAVLGVLFAMPA